MAPRKVYTWGVQLSTHDFFHLFWLIFFAPFLGEERVFALCFGPRCPRNTGGSAFFKYVFAKYGGQNVFCQIFLRNTGGKWASNMLSPVFLLRGGFWAISGGSSRAGTEKKRSRRRRKRRSRRRRGRRMTRRRIGTKKTRRRREQKERRRRRRRRRKKKQRKKNNKEETQ